VRFSDLNPLGRAIIVTVAGLTAGVAAVAFATSYGALYAWVRDTGLYADSGRYANRLNQAWPLLLDATFIVAELAAILFGILRGPRGWPITTMLATGALTVWFNLQHAGADPGRRLAAVVPPVLMMLAFQIDVAIVRAVMRVLGRPLESAAPLPHPGQVPAGLAGPGGSWSWAPSEMGRNGQGLEGGTKRQTIETYLDRLGPEQALALGARGIAADLSDAGSVVSERYVRQLLDARGWPAPPAVERGSAGSNGHRGPLTDDNRGSSRG
jgi:hypothetical protein